MSLPSALLEGVSAVLGIHAFRSGRYLHDLPTPHVVILGGTDVNQTDGRSREYLAVMEQAVRAALVIVAFNEQMRENAKRLWPFLDDRDFAIIPQAVSVSRAYTGLALRERLGLGHKPSPRDTSPSTASLILLLSSGLRDVKDPTYLFDVVKRWASVDPRVHFVVIGPRLESDCTERVLSQAAQARCIHVLEPVSLSEMHFLMQDADFVVNCSKSEGLAAVVLEAMALGVPVVARNIPGNRSVIQHGHTGFLFDSPEDFLRIVLSLLPETFRNSAATGVLAAAGMAIPTDQTQCLPEVVENALRYVSRHHSCEKEAASYRQLVQRFGSA